MGFRNCIVALGLWGGLVTAHAGVEVLYSTGFEYDEGFNAAYELPWLDGWMGDPYNETPNATNSSGIISNAAAPPSQEAYVGFYKPNPPANLVSVWKPINHVPTDKPLVHFEVFMTIASSVVWSSEDNFRWRVRNMNGQHLFSVDFDNFYKDVSYLLDDGITNVTTQLFTNDVGFWFSLDMDFESNQWSASINDVPFITGLPITTKSASLTLGDVDAVWAIYDPANPGDNFMIFDNYLITAMPTGTDLAWIERLGFAGSAFVLRLHGPNDCRYAIETTTDLLTWIPLKTNVVTDGSFDYVHSGPAPSLRRFYRARFVP